MDGHIFQEISTVIALGAAIALIMRLLKQPLIIGHILTGLLVGPQFLHLIKTEEVFEIFAEIGIALLLFIIGLGLSIKEAKEVGKTAFVTATVQMIFTTVFGYLAIVALSSFSGSEAWLMALGLSFSSTIIILKVLSDKKDQNRLYAKLAIGLLLVQDIAATIALLVIAAADGSSVLDLSIMLVSAGWAFFLIFLFSSYVLPRFKNLIAGSQEFLFLFALGWAFGIAALFEIIGLSVEIGALFAGVSLSSLPYAQEIGSRMRPLRDFFIIVFFITLGTQINFDNIGDVLVPVIGLSLFVAFLNPMIVMVMLGLQRYKKRTSFNAAATVGQVSEFSLILLLLANERGWATEGAISLITLVALVTIALSTYVMSYADKIFDFLEDRLGVFERKSLKPEHEHNDTYDIVLFGYQKGGNEFAKTFQKMKKRFVVVEYDPTVIDRLEHLHLPYVYGDATDSELLEELNIAKSKMVVATMTDHKTNSFIVKSASEANPKAIIIAHSVNEQDAAELYEYGATHVLIPHRIGSHQLSNFMLKNGLRKSSYAKQLKH